MDKERGVGVGPPGQFFLAPQKFSLTAKTKMEPYNFFLDPPDFFNIKRTPSEIIFLLEPLQKNVFGSPKKN